MINVLVVEDSPVARELLLSILSDEKEINVVGVAHTGEEAIKLNEQLKPNVITMDVNLPGIDGLQATKTIMATHPAPIVIVSSGFEPHNINHSIEALKAGAVAIAKKPEAYGTEDFISTGQKLIQMIKLMSEIKVIKRQPQETVELPTPNRNGIKNKIEIIGIGASTGGPAVIEEILANLPYNFNIPIVIVQHIAEGFTDGFIEWLNQKSALKVVKAEHGMEIKGGYCYIAPDNQHLKINGSATIMLTHEAKVNGAKPSVSVFFESLANVYDKSAIAILLSGMGKDGADQLKVMKDKGSITIAQDSSSSLIFGMPGEAVKLKAAKYIMSKEQIISFLSGMSIENNK